MNYTTLDRLLNQKIGLIIQYGSESLAVRAEELKREGDFLIRETPELLQVFPIHQIFIIHLKTR